MVIEAAFFDVDDVIVPHLRHGARNFQLARDGRKYIDAHPGVYWSALTGQPKMANDEVIRAAGIKNRCAYEMGYLLGRPDEEPRLAFSPEHYPDIAAVETLRRRLYSDGIVKETAEKYGLDADVIREKQAMLSFFVKENKGGLFVDKVLPEITDADVKRYVESGDIEILNPGYAVDLKPRRVGKGPAQELMMEEAGVRPETTLIGVDSPHSDKGMIDAINRGEKKGYLACPADADPEIIRIAKRDFRNRAYVSKKKCKDGAFADILAYAEANWGFV